MKVYTAAEIMKSLPVLMNLHYKSFAQLKQLYRAAGGEAKGHHLTKRDCIMHIAFGPQVADDRDERIASLEAELAERGNQLTVAQAEVRSAKQDAQLQAKDCLKAERDRDSVKQLNEELLSTFRQLMMI